MAPKRTVTSAIGPGVSI